MVTSTRTNRRPQMAIEEESLDDPTGELERLLDDRAEANELRKPAMRTYKAKHTLAKEAVTKIVTERELGEGTYRVGEHVISVTKTDTKKIEFERVSNTIIRFSIAKS